MRFLPFVAVALTALSLCHCASSSDGNALRSPTTAGDGGANSGGAPTGGHAGEPEPSSGVLAGSAGAPNRIRSPGPLAEYGFEIGLPQTHDLVCDGDRLGSPRQVKDSDWLCTFDYGGSEGHLYVQATPIACTFRYSIDTTFNTQAYLSINGQVQKLAEPSYDWGSYHHIDSLTFEWDGQRFEYGHSSLGSDYRICRAMDCAQVRDAATDTLIEDGCTAERSRPIVCVPILDNGTHSELIDDFISCDASECAAAGGTIETTTCCSTVVDFPDECTALDCSCSAESSREVIRCACPEGSCYDRASVPRRCRR